MWKNTTGFGLGVRLRLLNKSIEDKQDKFGRALGKLKRKKKYIEIKG